MPTKFSQGLVTASVDADELRRAISKLPKEIQNEIRDSNLQNSAILVQQIKGEIGAGDPPQAELMKGAIRPVRDRVIRVDAGGPKQVGRAYKSRTKTGRKYRAPAGLIVYGAEYGSSGKPEDRRGRKMGARYVRPHNEQGYFIGPALRQFAPRLVKIWEARIQTEIKKRGLK